MHFITPVGYTISECHYDLHVCNGRVQLPQNYLYYAGIYINVYYISCSIILYKTLSRTYFLIALSDVKRTQVGALNVTLIVQLCDE